MCNWKGRIMVRRDKPLNLCDIECYGNHDIDHVRQKPHRMASAVRKTISSRAPSVTPSIMATGKLPKRFILESSHLNLSILLIFRIYE